MNWVPLAAFGFGIVVWMWLLWWFYRADLGHSLSGGKRPLVDILDDIFGGFVENMVLIFCVILAVSVCVVESVHRWVVPWKDER